MPLNSAGGRLLVSGEQIEKGGFAAARGAHYSGKLPALDPERYLLQYFHHAETVRNLADLKRTRPLGSRRIDRNGERRLV